MAQTPELVHKCSAGIHSLVVVATTLVFALSSAPAVILLLEQLSFNEDIFDRLPDHYRELLGPIEYGIALGSSAVADVVMLWRCFVVWNNDWRVMVVPVFGFFSTHASGFLIAPDSPILAASVALMAVLIEAIRMIKMGREVIAQVGTEPRAVVRIVIATILESGLISSVYTTLIFCISMAEAYIGGFEKVLEISMRLWPTVSATVSAIIVVRSALGMSFNNVDSAMASIGIIKVTSPVDIVRTFSGEFRRTLSGNSITKDYGTCNTDSDGEPSTPRATDYRNAVSDTGRSYTDVLRTIQQSS
ncbi:hypothetical protein VNI00_004515 [Paramarasmius palmivorus]|uniref:Uncharacterized protein n=1 Tax=Paramarasmius palmivorus TaxID=297713 RepID=A0AAW0DFB6_9AGAR